MDTYAAKYKVSFNKDNLSESVALQNIIWDVDTSQFNNNERNIIIHYLQEHKNLVFPECQIFLYQDNNPNQNFEELATCHYQIMDTKFKTKFPNNKQHTKIIMDILWNKYIDFDSLQEERNFIQYASAYINKSENNKIINLPKNKAKLSNRNQIENNLVPMSIDKEKIVKYAYKWSKNGAKKRNPDYPSFKYDCTNFVSQAIHAGGIRMVGEGGCEDERTDKYWYVGDSSWYCLTDKWAWKTTWSLVVDFWEYHTSFTNNATYEVFNYSNLSTLIAKAEPGDIVQLQPSKGGNKIHSMIITKKGNNTVYLTYHTAVSDNLNDKVDVSIWDIKHDDISYNYWLISFN